MAEKTAFVTGSTGFLGLNLVEQLCADGWRVVAMHRRASDLTWLRRFPVEPVQADLLDTESLRRTMPEGLDAVFHLAADTSVWSGNNRRQTRVNVEGTRNVIAAARAAGVGRFVHTSTWNVFAPDVQAEVHEDSPRLAERSWINYNRTKFLAEEAVREAVADGLDAVILNPGHIVGRHDRHNWARLIRMALQGRIPGVPSGAGSFCHGEAAARAHIAAFERAPGGRSYLLGGADATFADLVRAAGEVTGRKVPARPLPAFVFRLAARVNAAAAAFTGREPIITPEGVAIVCTRARIVSTRAQEELDYRPVALRDMVADCCAWLQGEGLL